MHNWPRKSVSVFLIMILLPWSCLAILNSDNDSYTYSEFKDEINNSIFDDGQIFEFISDYISVPSYDAAYIKVNDLGLPIEVTDSLNRTTYLEYDNEGKIVQITDPLGNKVKIGYETDSNQVAFIQDALGRITNFSYDNQGNLLCVTYPDFSKECRIYDENNRLSSKIDRNGQSMEYSFDDRGLLVSKKYPDGTFVAYTYDDAGRMIEAANSRGNISFEYDDTNSTKTVTYPGGRSFSYEYDASGMPVQMVDPDGKIQNYVYDESGRLVEVTDGTQRIVEYQYDDANKRIRKTLGNGAYTTYEYDASGSVAKLVNYDSTGNVTSYFNYTYDAVGNCLFRDTIEGTDAFSYDSLNQLIKVEYHDGTTVEYVYDAAGNRLEVIEDGTAENYEVNELNQYKAVGSTKYEYDGNGNLISKTEGEQTTYYEYDFENRLIHVEMLNETIHYTYNPLGLRDSRTDSNGTVRYLWDGYRVAIEENEMHETTADYVWGGVLDEIVRMERGSDRYYYAQDAMFSVSDLIDSSGLPIEHYQYSVFGEPMVESSLGNPWLFTGAAYDFKAGLQYNHFRYYTPKIGRFITLDPIVIAGNINLYAYAGNNPVTHCDIFGLWNWDRAWENAIGGALEGGFKGAAKYVVPAFVLGGPIAPEILAGRIILGAVIGGAQGFVEGGMAPP